MSQDVTAFTESYNEKGVFVFYLNLFTVLKMLYFVLRSASRRSNGLSWDRLPVVSNLNSHPFLFSRRLSYKIFPSNVLQNQVGRNGTRRRLATWTLFRPSALNLSLMKVKSRCINDSIYVHGRKCHQLSERDYEFFKGRILKLSQTYLRDSYETEITESYEENTEEKSLFDVVQYMVAVINALMLLPRVKSELYFQDDRLTSAFQTMLNTGLIENSTQDEVFALLNIGFLVSVDDVVRRFFLELERCVATDFHSWEPLVALRHCGVWIDLSIPHQYMYLENEIRLLMLHIINEPKNLHFGVAEKLLYIANRAMIKGGDVGYHWFDKRDYALFTNMIGPLYFDNKANAKRLDLITVNNFVSILAGDGVKENVPTRYMWKILDVLKTSLAECSLEKYASRYKGCILSLLRIAISQQHEKNFDFKQYSTELASLLKAINPHITPTSQLVLANSFCYYANFYDQEMAGNIIENFMNGVWDDRKDYISKIINLYVRSGYRPSGEFVVKVCSILADRKNDFSWVQLIHATWDLMILGYSEVYDGLLDRLFLYSDLKELESVAKDRTYFVRLVRLYQALEVEKVDKYVQHIPPSHYHLEIVQLTSKALKERCQNEFYQGLLGAVQSMLGGPEKARILPVYKVHKPIVEFCVDEMNQPVNLDTVPEVFDSNGFVLMENVSALPSNLKRIAVWILRRHDRYGNKPNVLTEEMMGNIRFLNGAGYSQLVIIPPSVRVASNFTSILRTALKKIDGIKLTDLY